MYLRLVAIALAVLFAAACIPETTSAPPPSSRGTAVAAVPVSGVVPAGRWRAVLIAGDNNSPAFDNGVQSMRDKLVAHGVRDIAVYSSAASKAPAVLASVANVATAVRAGGGDACFVFITSHGEERGFFLRPDRRLFDPGSLDRVLNAGCGSLPTVVVVSACHSGTFLTPDMRKPNRVILTAAATDRTSFGCGPATSTPTTTNACCSSSTAPRRGAISPLPPAPASRTSSAAWACRRPRCRRRSSAPRSRTCGCRRHRSGR